MKKKNKVKTNFGLLILSSVMMVVFMIKPTYDLHMAIRMHLKQQDHDVSIIANILSGIIWNLTTVAFALNTIVAIRFTPNIK